MKGDKMKRNDGAKTSVSKKKWMHFKLIDDN